MTALIFATALISVAAAAQGPVPGTSFATAPELQPGSYRFHLQAGDLHFFRITLKQGQTLFITLRMASDVDFDIAVLSPERDLLESGVRPAGFYERISLKAPVTGSYYIVVYPFGISSGSYTLELRRRREARTGDWPLHSGSDADKSRRKDQCRQQLSPIQPTV